MVQGALFVPGFARADCHGDGTPIRPGASGTKAAADVLPGVSRYRLSRLICRRPTSAGAGVGSRLTPHAGPLPSGTGSTGTRWLGSRLRRPVGRRVGGYGAQSEYIKVRSVVDDRAESAGAQQVAATGPQIPQAHIGRTVRPAVQVPFEHRREQAGAPDEIAERVVLGDLAELASRGAGTRGSRRREPARRGRRRTASRSAWSHARRYAAQVGGDGEQPAARICRILVVLPD